MYKIQSSVQRVKTHAMKNGLARFDYFLNQLQLLLDKAVTQKNPALWLYRNNARTPLFMLEGLAKLYAGLHNKKKFTRLKEHFKYLEDGLGAIDYYDAFAKEFATKKNIPGNITAYLQAVTREKTQSLNELLIEKKWLGKGNERITRIRKKLSDAGWMDDDKEVEALNDFYGKAIYECVEFVHSRKYHFENVEADVHELRRKLRWLSIYPQALRGCIQLSKATKTGAQLNKYQTPAITSSPFNKMPDVGDNRQLLLLNQQYFFALSWIIAELGSLKDNALRVVAVKEALQQGNSMGDDEAYKKTYEMLGNQQPKLPALISKAETICKTWFGENNLEHLVIGVAAVKK
jgi:hypothetical protein